ncbi:MAG: hypothetical protein U9O86_01910 [Campylobacterota bacterium]|nr:hypothetical protein [Campylobacterota bacterium]
MTLYELYKYTPKQIIEVEYLLDQAKRFDILDEVQEAFFQFSPDLVEEKIEGFGEHEPWATSHKRHIVNEIIYYLIENVSEGEYIAEYWINEQIFKESFTPFILQNDLRKLDNEKIFELFKTYLDNKINKGKGDT